MLQIRNEGVIEMFSKRWLSQAVCVVALVMTSLPPLHAQRKLTIIEPQEGKSVSEDLTVTVSRPRPDQGYLIFKVDGVIKEATSEVQYVIDTKGLPDGEHVILVEDHDGTGALVETTQVKVQVANKIGAGEATYSAVPLIHWDYQQFLDKEITRYEVWAQGIAASDKMQQAAPAGGAAGGTGGSQQQSSDVIVLDRQLSLKIRQMIRDIQQDGTANIRTIVEGGHERWRHYEQASSDPEEPPSFAGAGGWCFGGGGQGQTQQAGGAAAGAGGPGAAGAGPGGAGAAGGGAAPAAPPVKVWDGEGSCDHCIQYKEEQEPPAWCPSAEVGRTYTKRMYQSGREVSATRRDQWPYEIATRFAMSELQPMFSDHPVRPGETWNSEMTFVCELAERRGIKAVAPLRFVGFEWQGGKKTAKLEAEFDLPEIKAKEVANVCIDFVMGGNKSGTDSSGAAGGGLGPGATLGGQVKKKPTKFLKPPRVHIKRIIYFDYARKKILRTEDQVNGRYEFKPPAASGAGGGGPMGGGAMAGGAAGGASGGQSQSEPEKWSYSVTIITQLDETPAVPTPGYNQGGINPHDYDNVPEKNDRPVATSDVRRPNFE